jgi:phosphatidylglycerophosphatase A
VPESASAVRGPTAADRVALAIATGGGAGYSPVAPGTVGSAVAVLLLWLIPFSRGAVVTFLVAVVLVGTWAAHRAERLIGGKDPGAIVIDEVAGMILSVLALPPTPWVLVAGFLLFRLFDVVKPPPAHALQRLPGGVGIMLDDMIAGAYALAVLAVARGLFGWP